MKTGLIWNGGEVPTIGEDTYLSLAEEMMKPLGEPKGKPWRQRLPTPLTILQAESIGLVVEKALPCICDNETYEDNLGSFCDDGEFGFIKKPDAQIGGPIEPAQPVEVPADGRFIENIDIKNGKLQLTTGGKNRQVVAQISLEAIKREMNQE
jgi:hypothetical protein